MTLRTLVAAGVYASLVPLVSAIGSGGLPIAAAPFAEVEAPPAQSSASTGEAPAPADWVPIRSTNLVRRDAREGLAAAVRGVVEGRAPREAPRLAASSKRQAASKS